MQAGLKELVLQGVWYLCEGMTGSQRCTGPLQCAWPEQAPCPDRWKLSSASPLCSDLLILQSLRLHDAEHTSQSRHTIRSDECQVHREGGHLL